MGSLSIKRPDKEHDRKSWLSFIGLIGSRDCVDCEELEKQLRDGIGPSPTIKRLMLSPYKIEVGFHCVQPNLRTTSADIGVEKEDKAGGRCPPYN